MTWQEWMKPYRFGTLLLEPPEPVLTHVNRLREKFNLDTLGFSQSHVTLTQPLRRPLHEEEWQKVRRVIASQPRFTLQIGPLVLSPNQELLWLDIEPKRTLLCLRGALHELGYFDMSLPFTSGFIPHMTISELRRDPKEAQRIATELNCENQKFEFEVQAVQWSVPNELFHFQVKNNLPLKKLP